MSTSQTSWRGASNSLIPSTFMRELYGENVDGRAATRLARTLEEVLGREQILDGETERLEDGDLLRARPPRMRADQHLAELGADVVGSIAPSASASR